jgi:hypothetical protein
VPSGSTQVERRAIRESAHRRRCQPGVPDRGADGGRDRRRPAGFRPTGSMVVDIGGGTTEVGVISLGGMVYAGSVRVGGDKLDEAIINYISRNYGMLIGENTAENIKKNIGSAFPGAEVREMEVSGINKAEGIPRKFTISSNEILEALTEPLNSIVSAVKSALEKTPPELGADIAEGHGADRRWRDRLLRDLDRLLMEETGLPVIVADEPLTCVARGCGLALEKMDKLGSILPSGLQRKHGARPLLTRVIVDKGQQSGIVAGQPAIDEAGVVGQVTRVFPFSAEVTLITDKDQACRCRSCAAASALWSSAWATASSNCATCRPTPMCSRRHAGHLRPRRHLPARLPGRQGGQYRTRQRLFVCPHFLRAPIAGVENFGEVMVPRPAPALPPRRRAHGAADPAAATSPACVQEKARCERKLMQPTFSSSRILLPVRPWFIFSA